MNFPFQISHLRIRLTILLCLSLLAVTARQTSILTAQSQFLAYYVEYEPGRLSEATAKIEAAGGRVDYSLLPWRILAVSMPKYGTNNLNSFPSISYSEPVPVYEPASEQYPFGLDSVQALDVWDFDRDGILDPDAPVGNGIKVCIIDTGLFDSHKDLADTNISGFSMIAGESWNETMTGHGTHVAGTVAANMQGLGLSGVAPGVDLFIVKILNNEGDWVEGQSNMGVAAKTCVDNGANIISVSLKGTYSRVEELIFASIFERQGVLTVAAAANDGKSTGSEDIYNYPASYDSVVSVGAITSAQTHAPYSNENDQVELAAPGSGVMSTWPEPENGSIPFGRVIDGTSVHVGSYLQLSTPGSVTAALVDGGFCGETDKSANWSGKIVLCQRDGLLFRELVANTESQGAVATIIIWRDPGLTAGTLGTGSSSGPAVIITQQSGDILKSSRLGTTITVETGDGSSPLPGPGGYQKLNGTSMAAPHVAGAAALIWSACPDLNNSELRDVMAKTALDLGDPGRDITFGYGLVQSFAGWHYCQQADLGDSARSYGQVRHTGFGQLRLGSSWEADSWQGDYPGAGHDANDNGIVFPALQVGQYAWVDVWANGVAQNPWVSGWLDLNWNGKFDDDELIVDGPPNLNTTTRFYFQIPTYVGAASSFNYRFRLYDRAVNPNLSTVQEVMALPVTINGGEVEDGATAIPTAVGLKHVSVVQCQANKQMSLMLFAIGLIFLVVVAQRRYLRTKV